MREAYEDGEVEGLAKAQALGQRKYNGNERFLSLFKTYPSVDCHSDGA